MARASGYKSHNHLVQPHVGPKPEVPARNDELENFRNRFS